jgi:ATP-dependent exoDNAse (exonuclease V) beta subunit
MSPTLDGLADFVWDDGDRLVVVDYKTDVAIGPVEPSYRRQIAPYADALSRAYGRQVNAVLLRA